ncbi:MAG: flagellar basal body rod protein FlgB [Rubrivivax sp.]
MLNRLTTQIDFQSQALLLRSERQRVLASNIANADTPGYQARDFDFKAALSEATAGLRGADANRLGGPIARGASGLAGVPAATAPTLRYATPSQTNLDGNTVDMDRERASIVDNTVRYEATLRFINSSLRTLQDAMKSHHGA